MKVIVSKFVSSIFLVTAVASNAHTETIFSEVVNGNGETRVTKTRVFTASKSGAYHLVLKNGVGKTSPDLTRIREATFTINGAKVQAPEAKEAATLTDKTASVRIPIQLIAGANEIQTSLIGYSSSRVQYSIEATKETAEAKPAPVITGKPGPRVVKSSALPARLVADEILFAKKKYRGSFLSESVSKENIVLPSAQLARINIENADAEEEIAKPCPNETWSKNLQCATENFFRRAYFNAARVQGVELVVNGKPIQNLHVNRNTTSQQAIVSLEASNNIEVRIKGWPTSSMNFEVQSLEENVAPIAHVTFTAPGRGTPKTVEFNAGDSTDANDQVSSYRFQARPTGTTTYTLDTDWQANPLGSLTFTSAGTYDLLVSARDTYGEVGTTTASVTILSNVAPVIATAYYLMLNQTANYQVRVVVRATDADAGDTLSYNFTFSNGQSTGYQASGTATTFFNSLGNKSATVTVKDEAGATVTQVIPLALVANQIPVSKLAFINSRGGYAPHNIYYDASASFDPDGPTSELSYIWNFGDGSPEIVGSPFENHIYSTPGEYTMTMTAVDAKRGASTQSRAVFAWLNAPPQAIFTHVRVPSTLSVNFDASTSTPGNSAIAKYTWEYGDGTFDRNLTTPTATHTYSAAGVYSVFLRVYDQEGDANSYNKVVTVFSGQKPTANVNVTLSDSVAPAQFEFNATGSATPNPDATIVAYRWTLPGGAILTTPTATFSTAVAGTFNIQLEVQDSLGFWSDPTIKPVTATTGALPIAVATVNKSTIALGETVQLSGVTSSTPNAMANLMTYEWTTPNGTKIYGPVVNSKLTATGLKTLTLKVTDSKGYVSATASVQVMVQARQNPTAVIGFANNGSTTYPRTIRANGMASTTPNPNSSLTSYEWRITAPTTPATDITMFGTTVDINLTQASTWTVALRVFDSAGATSAWTTQVYSGATNLIPTAVISPLGLIDTEPSDVVFNGLSSSDPNGHSIIAWEWLFSDGGSASGPSPTHRFQSAGSYTATLRVQDSQWAWSDPVTMSVTILPNQAPIALVQVSTVPGERYKRNLNASTSYDSDGSIASYKWYLHQPRTLIGSAAEISYVFPQGGNFGIDLEVYDNKGVIGTTTTTVTVIANPPPVPKFTSTIIDSPTRRIALDASTSTDDSSIASYNWDFPDGTTATGAQIEKTFSNGGFATVRLTVTDSEGLSRSVTRSVSIQSLPVSQHEVMRCETR